MNRRLFSSTVVGCIVALFIAILAPEVAGFLLVAVALVAAVVVVSQSVRAATPSTTVSSDKPRPFLNTARLQPSEQPQLLAELISEMSDSTGKSTRGATNEVLRQAIARRMFERHGLSVFSDADRPRSAQLLGPRLWPLVAPNTPRPHVAPHNVAALIKEIESI